MRKEFMRVRDRTDDEEPPAHFHEFLELPVAVWQVVHAASDMLVEAQELNHEVVERCGQGGSAREECFKRQGNLPEGQPSSKRCSSVTFASSNCPGIGVFEEFYGGRSRINNRPERACIC